MLNPDTPGSFNTNSIKVFYTLNGKILDDYQHYIKNFYIGKPDSTYVMVVFPNLRADTSDTYIQWDETDKDKLTCLIEKKISKEGFSTICTKIWLNGELKWSVEDNKGERHIVIVKDRLSKD